MSTHEGIKTRYISRERYDLLRRMIEQCVARNDASLGDGTVAYTTGRENGQPRVYLLCADKAFCPWRAIRYFPIPESEE